MNKHLDEPIALSEEDCNLVSGGCVTFTFNNVEPNLGVQAVVILDNTVPNTGDQIALNFGTIGS